MLDVSCRVLDSPGCSATLHQFVSFVGSFYVLLFCASLCVCLVFCSIDSTFAGVTVVVTVHTFMSWLAGTSLVPLWGLWSGGC